MSPADDDLDHAVEAVKKICNTARNLQWARDRAHVVALMEQAGFVTGPRCRECADNDGTCPNNRNLPCDPEKARAVLADWLGIPVTRLTGYGPKKR